MRRLAFALATVLAALAPCVVPADAEPARIALTFDDVPGLTVLDDQPYVTWFNTALLAGLRRHRIPATGFVNEGKIDELKRDGQIAIMKAWLKAGMDLGNHTFSHESPNTLGAKGYIADIARGEPVTKSLLAARGRKLRWFRHPYLETGTPEAVKREIDQWLAGHGYRIAPVTIDAEDWVFAEPYDDAIARHDEPRRLRLREAYLRHTESMIAWYRKAAHALYGRDIAYIMLLHDTRLNADCIDDLATLLHQAELKPVSLEAAMRDPAYLTPDTYAGHEGIEWLERWSIGMKKPLPWDSYRDPPAEIQAEYDKVDADARQGIP